MVIVSRSNYLPRFLNSLIIAFGSTLLSVSLGVMAAYAFSASRCRARTTLMFFILSTRMMPPIAVAIPIYLMYRELGLSDTKLGMILLYSAVNVSLAVWPEGFIDEIPREYEEARDGRRLHAAAGVSQRSCCRRRRPASSPRRSSADLRVERVRVSRCC